MNSEEITIHLAHPGELHILAGLALLLWPSHTLQSLENEFREIMEKKESAFFVLEINSVHAGFAQCQLRHDYVEGTDSSPVGYLEGIFVREEYRKQGHAKALLKSCERWAKSQGCLEFASDCELSNDASFRFHQNMGFKEAGRIICFTKKL